MDQGFDLGVHILDTAVIRLLDGTRAYLHAVTDNFSRRILAWLLVHPAGHCHQQEPERVHGFRHVDSNIITGLHGANPLPSLQFEFPDTTGCRLRPTLFDSRVEV